MRMLGEKSVVARWLHVPAGGEKPPAIYMDPGGVLTPLFPTDIEYKGELLPGVEWIMSPNKGVQ